jgi:hypothetical protein
MIPAFFEPTGHPDRFVATPHCHGAWSPSFLHGGPPSALLVRTIERLASSVPDPVQLTRFTVEILGPVPLGEVEVTARVARPGRRVELVEAELSARGRSALLVRAWRIRQTEMTLPVPAGVLAAPEEFPGFPPRRVDPPEPPAAPTPTDLAMWHTGYAGAIEWRFVTGGPAGEAPAAVWARPRLDLVAGEPATPLQRLLLLADTGNGLSRVLDVDTWWFINTELTVHLHRQPVGEWLFLAARSTVEEHGAGLTETELFDRHGRVGRAAQALLVGPR